MMNDEFSRTEYFELLYRVAVPLNTDIHQINHVGLMKLNKIINLDLFELARKGSPDNFAGILQNFRHEMQRFQQFCAFPDVSKCNIVGIGGRFSSGKSSFINALLGKKVLNADVNPTTSLPTYLLHGEQNSIDAINLFQQRVAMTEREFGSLTYEVQKQFGSQVGALLQCAHIKTPEFPWHNLAVLDTPGYTKPETDEYSERTDERIAHAQLNSSHYLLWLISAEDGTITEDDIQFLSNLNSDIPRLVLINKADKKTPDDVQAIVSLVRKTLANRNIPVLDVIPVSSRRKDLYPLNHVQKYLQQWSLQPRQLTFARRFKSLFIEYRHYLETQQRQAAMQLNRLNRILMLSDNDSITQDAEGLQIQAKFAIEALNQHSEDLTAIQALFFKLLKQIGDKVGIEIPEPSVIDMLDVDTNKLPKLLEDLCQQAGLPEQDYNHYWQSLMMPTTLPNLDKLLRRVPMDNPASKLFSTL